MISLGSRAASTRTPAPPLPSLPLLADLGSSLTGGLLCEEVVDVQRDEVRRQGRRLEEGRPLPQVAHFVRRLGVRVREGSRASGMQHRELPFRLQLFPSLTRGPWPRARSHSAPRSSGSAARSSTPRRNACRRGSSGSRPRRDPRPSGTATLCTRSVPSSSRGGP